MLHLRTLLSVLLAIPMCSFAQDHGIRFPFWTFHDRGTTTIGLNLGVASTVAKRGTTVTTHGLHAEAIGLGFFLLLAPRAANALTEEEYEEHLTRPLSERINGLALSPLGTICNCLVNGASFNGGGFYLQEVNGIALALGIAESDRFDGFQGGGFNMTYRGSGLQLGIMNNWAAEMHGVQISAQNESKAHRGVQLGVYISHST